MGQVQTDIDHRPDSKKLENEMLITSPEAEKRGITSTCGPAPKPAKCEYCGTILYHQGFLSFGDDPHVFHWTELPQRCSCPKALEKWDEYDEKIKQENRAREAAQERAWRKQRVDELVSQSGIRKRFQGRTFERFIKDTPGRKHAYKIARDYAEQFTEKARVTGEGLYIEGNNGTGKTHLAAAIGLYLTEKEYSVVMKTSFDLLDEIKKAFDDQTRSEHQIMRAYRECDLLIIDDLGKEQCTDWSMSVLYSIINDRYEAMRPTIITTNFGEQDLISVLTPKDHGSQKIEAIISRLTEVNRMLKMAWEDYRGK